MSVRKALGLSAISQLVNFVLGFASVVIVSRLLTPAEIGVFSVAVSVLGFAHVFREFGVGQYLVQAKVVGREQLRAAFSLTLFFSWSIAAVLYLGRIPLAAFYNHEGIAEVLALLSLNFVLLPFGTPLLSLLQRELKFGTLAVVSICNSVASTTTTIVAALAGESYLSMAWGAIAGHITNIVLLNFIRRGEIFMFPTFKGLREIVKFGSVSSLVSFLSEIGASAPDLILGRTLGFSAVAYYSRAAGLRKMVLGQLATLVNKVYFPSFAKNVRSGQNPAELYSRAMNYLLAVTVPTMGLLALLAEPLIIFLFGPQWERAAPLATLLCVFSIISAPYSMANLSLVASGNINRVLHVQLAIQGLRVAILATSIWFSLEIVVPLLGLVAIAEAVFYQNALHKAFQLTFMTLMSITRTCFVLLPFALIGPAVAMYFLYRPDADALHLLITLAASGTLALGGWLLGVWTMRHPLQTEVLTVLKRLRLGKSHG